MGASHAIGTGDNSCFGEDRKNMVKEKVVRCNIDVTMDMCYQWYNEIYVNILNKRKLDKSSINSSIALNIFISRVSLSQRFKNNAIDLSDASVHLKPIKMK